MRTIKHQDLITIRLNQEELNEVVRQIVWAMREAPEEGSLLEKFMALATVPKEPNALTIDQIASTLQEFEDNLQVYVISEGNVPKGVTLSPTLAQRYKSKRIAELRSSPVAKFMNRNNVTISSLPILKDY